MIKPIAAETHTITALIWVVLFALNNLEKSRRCKETYIKVVTKVKTTKNQLILIKL